MEVLFFFFRFYFHFFSLLFLLFFISFPLRTIPFQITTYQDVALYAFNQYSTVCPTPSILSDEWDFPVDSFLGVTNWTPEICLGKRLRNQILDSIRMRFWDDREKYNFLEPPSISWINPKKLVPHEHTSPTHLAKLIDHLKRLDDDALLPTIIVSQSKPHVILDGHHRWQSSIHLNITRVPCWLVDDARADVDPYTLLPVPLSQYYNITYLAKQNQGLFQEHYTFYKLGVYDTRTSRKIRIREVAETARLAPPTFGIKGTKHVAVPVVWTSETTSGEHKNEEEEEIRLEHVAPRIEWGFWKRSGLGTFKIRGINVNMFRNFKYLEFPLNDSGNEYIEEDSKEKNSHLE
ncbi:hypothetical protein HMI54_012951 [Coelomomyces lativittatus]|nr:hypothetical protein HMI56_005213 [Coelomomyces lativittatus]KAJ1516867.1 hypothetical protein HMI55_001195 [Coelomomyces lativittatus]KAJ1518653.1 hypothetical protein HMI54_012951 [Coelomomyces lativittatus]